MLNRNWPTVRGRHARFAEEEEKGQKRPQEKKRPGRKGRVAGSRPDNVQHTDRRLD